MDIIAYIKRNGKTVTQVCREAGVSRETFYATIKPGSNPSFNTLTAIARAAGLSIHDIKPEEKP
jgi:probable addiction module antidote protein